MEEASEGGCRASFHMMLLDAKFADAPTAARRTPPTVHLYGVTWEGRSVCCIIKDFKPYFWFPAPTTGSDLGEESLKRLRLYLEEQVQISKKRNASDGDSFVAQISLHLRTPLMYYRPGGPFQFLKVEVWRSKDIAIVAKVLTYIAQKNQGIQLGMSWQDCTCYEDEIKLGMRFFCDTDIAGGSWVQVLNPSIVHFSQQTTYCAEEFVASWHEVKGLTPDATQFMEFSPMQQKHAAGGQASFSEERTSTENEGDTLMQENVTGSLKLNADKQSKESHWLALSPLKVLVLDVQCGQIECTRELRPNSKRVPSGRGKRQKLEVSYNRQKLSGCSHGRNTSATDDVFEDVENISRMTAGHSLHPSRDPVLVITSILFTDGHTKKYVFMYGFDIPRKGPPGVDLRAFDNEHTMLVAWQEFFRLEADPDVICLYQLKDSIRYLVERFHVLKLGILDISRCKGRATEVKSVVSYGKHWVKQQARMTATSNQEVFRAVIEGRVVIDMLRVVLVAYNLSTFTLAECCQVFLGKTKEVLNSVIIADLWKGQYGGAWQLMNYSLNEAEVTWQLMQKLQTITEIIEMARVTGLSISDSLYKAQMIRVQSLLLRSAKKEAWLLGGPTINGQLSESPFLIHPKDCKTAGFYKDPVVILDFASLYPSLYMAHNLCYTTLVHPEDVGSFPEESLLKSPTGSYFVVPAVRHGILPRICGALITARKLAKEKMVAPNISSRERAVFDARQKALKLCSNALYGFTGAGASPQQALPLADSCLSMGAAACKHAVELVSSTFEKAKVLYAQTDSVFIQFCGVTIEEAVELGHKAADVTSKSFPSPMSLKFEKVLCPFLLLQVNRYAGKDVTCSKNEDKGGTMFVRGLESERRDVPPFVRTVCKIVLQEILLNENVNAALDACKREIRRLVSGKCSMMELVMTGGLWRVDDHDISRLASSTKSPKKELAGAATAEEGRGPHVALAVRLKRNDPDRQFHIGERIQYVLVNNSSKLQDDMAEDPINAIKGNIQLNFHIYLENKLRKPLESILEYVADSSQIHDVFTGSHAVASAFAPSTSGHSTQASMRSFFKSKTPCLSCRKPLNDAEEQNALCKECCYLGAAQITLTSLLAENREIERKLFLGHAECMGCHSGGLYKPVLCTNTDCPIFYLRSENPELYRKLASSVEKLELACNVNQAS